MEFGKPQNAKMQFWLRIVPSWAAGFKPQRPHIVAYKGMQKFLPHITASGYKLMAKIATLWANNAYITLPPGPPVRGRYSWRQGPRIRNNIPSQVPQGPENGGAIRSGVVRNL